MIRQTSQTPHCATVPPHRGTPIALVYGKAYFVGAKGVVAPSDLLLLYWNV